MSTIYRMTFNNVEEQEIQCDIENPDGSDVISIEGAEDAIMISCVDNDEDKYTPVKAKKCTIKFLNSQTVNYETFATGADDSWKVTITINGNPIFIGWLEQNDIEEPFQYQENQVITLTANDGLGNLKHIRLVNFDGSIINNLYLEGTRLIDYIARSLYRTGHQLNINVINNLREENNPSSGDDAGNFYSICNVLPKTFEDGINECINCYEVLERILGHDCFLTQAKGEWWIVRVTELRQDFDTYITVFDYQGQYQSFGSVTSFEKAIGLKDTDNTPFTESPDATAYFSGATTTRLILRPNKSEKLIFKYEYPEEIPCNIDFTRGDFIDDLPNEDDENGISRTVKSYDLDCWSMQRGFPEHTPISNDSNVYIKRLFNDDGIELQKYVVITSPTTGDVNAPYIQSEGIPIDVKDKLNISVDFRFPDEITSGGGFFKIMYIVISGDDGSWWIHGRDEPGNSAEPIWYDTSGFTVNTALGEQGFNFATSVNDTDWQTQTFETKPAPVSGTLYIWLHGMNQEDSDSFDDVDIYYSNLRVEYIPFIDGTYQKFTGQSYKALRPDDKYKRDLEEQIYITNAPKKLMKGALMKIVTESGSGSHYELVGKFYEGQQFPADDPTSDDLFDFGEIQVQAFHNQHRNNDVIFRMRCQGLTEGETDGDGNDDHQDLIHRYYVRDLEPATNFIAYQLITFNQDLRNCEWTGTMIENFDIDRGFVQDDVEFKYETK